jgi:hypothetical protein
MLLSLRPAFPRGYNEWMDESRKKADWPIVAAVLAPFVLVTLAIYAGSYLALSTRYPFPDDVYLRAFRHKWQATIYTPAATVEGVLIRGKVVAAPSNDWGEAVASHLHSASP